MRYCRNNPSKSGSIGGAGSIKAARAWVRNTLNVDTSAPYPGKIDAGTKVPAGYVFHVTFTNSQWGSRKGFGPEYDRWYLVGVDRDGHEFLQLTHPDHIFGMPRERKNPPSSGVNMMAGTYSIMHANPSRHAHTRSKHAALLAAGDFEAAARVWKRSMAARKRKNPRKSIHFAGRNYDIEDGRYVPVPGYGGGYAPSEPKRTRSRTLAARPSLLDEGQQAAKEAQMNAYSSALSYVDKAHTAIRGARVTRDPSYLEQARYALKAAKWQGALLQKSPYAEAHDRAIVRRKISEAEGALQDELLHMAKKNPLGGPLTITHDGADLLIRHTHGNPRREGNYGGHPAPKFKVGDRVADKDGERRGTVEWVGSYQPPPYGGWTYKVQEDHGGPRNSRPEANLKRIRR